MCCIIEQHLLGLQTAQYTVKERVMFPKAAVVFALLALFSAGSQGNKEANVDHHHLVAWKERILRPMRSQPSLFRRDAETCSPESDEYYRRVELLACDEEFIRAVYNDIETSNCSNQAYDTTFFSQCGTNRHGTVCANIKDGLYEDFEDQCERSFDTNECSSECQTMLRQISDTAGCCIHDDDDLRMPSVWMNCNTEQPKVCADTPNISSILAKKRNVGNCTEKCSERQVYYTFCKSVADKFEKLNKECGVEGGGFCGFDKGEICGTYIYDLNTYNMYFETIYEECYSESEEGYVIDRVCSTNCSKALEELINGVGCCFRYFNDTYSDDIDLVASSNLCGIDIPDACSSFSSTALPDDYLECADLSIDNGAAFQSGVYSIGLLIIGLFATFI